MGRRHSKNAGIMGSESLTYHERKALGFGTVKERLGKVRRPAARSGAPRAAARCSRPPAAAAHAARSALSALPRAHSSWQQPCVHHGARAARAPRQGGCSVPARRVPLPAAAEPLTAAARLAPTSTPRTPMATFMTAA